MTMASKVPICAFPGCTNRVKWRHCRYCCPGHVPKAVRQANGRMSRPRYTYRVRRERFAKELAMLENRIVTRDQLLAVFHSLARTYYNSGYNAKRRGYTPADLLT